MRPYYEVILDRGESANKCTIAPLAGREDFRIWRVKDDPVLGPLRSEVLLHPEGECLSSLRGTLAPVQGIAAVDSIWRRVPVLLGKIHGGLPQLARIPEGFVTAYPRTSEHGHDPDGGLATIEAIFIAAALLGRWDPSLLLEYYFGAEFVKRNAGRFASLGVREALDPALAPVLRKKPRTSEQRKADRRV